MYIGWLDYGVIWKEYEDKNGFIWYWDFVVLVFYLFNLVDSIFIFYDDFELVVFKMDYV